MHDNSTYDSFATILKPTIMNTIMNDDADDASADSLQMVRIMMIIAIINTIMMLSLQSDNNIDASEHQIR